MKTKLGYGDKIVEITDGEVLVFDGRLRTAPLEDVIMHYLSGSGVLPPAVKNVSEDIVRFLLRTGELETIIQSKVQYGESLSD